MAKKVTIVKKNGNTTQITVKDDKAARAYEDLPFKDSRVVSVTVTNATKG